MTEETQICAAPPRGCGEPRPLDQFREGIDADVCGRCRYGSLVIGQPSDFPSKTQSAPQKPREANSYNAGIPTDARGMPWLDKNMAPIGQKKFDEKRHVIDEFERARRQPGGLEALRKVT